jgi:hypothetical protein
VEKKKKERKSKKKNMWKPKRFYDNEVYTPGWRLMILVMMMVFSLAASIYYLVDRSNGNQNLQAACADCNKRLNHANLNHSKLQFLTEQEQKENEKQFARPYEHWSNYRITATNTSSSTSVAGQSVSTDDSVSLVSGGLIGIFAPIANFVTGEMLRKVLDQTKEERVKAKAEYKQALIDYDTKMRQRFVLYLKRQGITDATQILKLSSGEAVEVAEVAVPKPATIEPTTKDYSYPPRITELVDKLRANGDTELGYKAIQEKYGVYPADISKAKQMLKN